ncbi:MAG TPA: hypothetical protein VK638_44530 [Edaphobacter sp.]|nr:hypothetical protein [Edaphobacter sp.]
MTTEEFRAHARVQLEKAEERLEAASLKVSHWEAIQDFQVITDEECRGKKLCSVSGEGGKVHCGKPGVVGYTGGMSRKKFQHYLCSQHAFECRGLLRQVKINWNADDAATSE